MENIEEKFRLFNHPSPVGVGDIIIIERFSFTGPLGGTRLSNWDHNEKFSKPHTKVKIIRLWDDYECGVRGWAIPVDENIELKEYLKKNAKPGCYVLPIDEDIHYDDWPWDENLPTHVCWSEFDILVVNPWNNNVSMN